MAPIDPAGTARLYLDYTLGGQGHTVIFRFGDNGLPALAAPVFATLLAANPAAFGSNVEFVGARQSFSGSNVTNPLPWDVVEFVGTAVAAVDAPRFVSWVGRTSEGRRVRYYFYGMNLDSSEPADYRLTGEEVPVVAAFQDDLYSFLEELNVVAIDSNPAVMKPYANVGYSAYYQRKARS